MHTPAATLWLPAVGNLGLSEVELTQPASALGLQADLKAVCSRDAAINSQLQQEAAKLLASLLV